MSARNHSTSRSHKDAVLLDARTVAVIGASPDDNKIGGKPMRFLREFNFRGQIFPVNPRYQEIGGYRCYPDVASIEEPIDAAIVAVPYQHAQPIIEECVRQGVRQIIMFSSGYAETGAEGAMRQQMLLRTIGGSSTRLLGPNTLGLANLESGFIANFSQAFELPPGVLRSGRAGFVSQSGAFGTFIFTLCAEQGLGFKYFIVTGNEGDITVSELIDAMVDDGGVDLVAGYVEGVRDGRRFLAACEKARAAGKPVVLIKTGRTPGGSAAAMSHTAAIAGSDEVYEAVFRQTGVIRVDDEEEMLDLVTLMRSHKAMRGRRVGVLTMSGGAGVLIADALESNGLELARLDPKTEEELAKVVPEFGSRRNPVDLTGQFLAEPQMLRSSLDILLRDPNTDAVLFFLGLGRRYGQQIAETLREISAKAEKPMLVAWIAGPQQIIAQLRADGIAVLPSPTRAVRALSALAYFGEAHARQPRSFELIAAQSESISTTDHAGRCSEAQSKAVLERYGIKRLPEVLARSEEEAVASARSIGYPVVLKVCAADLPHKTEAGAVALNLRDEAAVRNAYHRILDNARRHAPGLNVEGVLVSPVVDGGVEVIVGGRRDPVFGPVVMVGSGGIYTEVLRDAAIGVLPLVKGEAEELIRSLRVYPLLAGARGKPPADIEALAATIEAVAKLMLDHPEVSEVEINPLRVLERGRGAVPLDALMVLQTA